MTVYWMYGPCIRKKQQDQIYKKSFRELRAQCCKLQLAILRCAVGFTALSSFSAGGTPRLFCMLA